MKKKNTWTKKRHNIIGNIARVILKPCCKFMYGITVEGKKEGQYLILMNHQTAFDQFFVSMAFKGMLYFIATEDIFSTGWIARLLNWAVAPIPIRKQTADLRTVKTCIKVVREGGTIALSPEGNRTYSGRTCSINPAIAGLARVLKLPVAFFKIEGGYGIHPRWSDVRRKGRMYASVTRILEPEEIAELTDEQLFEIIQQELYADESHPIGDDHNEMVSREFHHTHRAEYLERVFYVCPKCGFASFKSKGDEVKCTSCGLKIRYAPDMSLEVSEEAAADFMFKSIGEWYDYQCDFVNAINPYALKKQPIFTDGARLSEVIVYERKELIDKSAKIELYGNRIVIDGAQKLEFLFDETDAVTVLGKNKANIYYCGRIYQLKGDKRFNALKYVNIFNRYNNVRKGNTNGKFLGI